MGRKILAEKYLSADRSAEGVREGFAVALHVGVVFGFDHDAGERLGAGVAKHDAAGFAERGLGVGEGAGDFGERIERRLGAHFYVDDGLRVVLETVDEVVERAVHGNERGDLDGGEQAVAGGGVIQKNDVAGLLAAQSAPLRSISSRT